MLIKDLELARDLGREEQAAVRGGDNGAANVGTIAQVMNLNVPVALMNAGPANTNINVTGTQNANQVTYQHAGDSFLVAFPFLRGLPLAL
jgi:hypothetical protein